MRAACVRTPRGERGLDGVARAEQPAACGAFGQVHEHLLHRVARLVGPGEVGIEARHGPHQLPRGVRTQAARIAAPRAGRGARLA